MEALKITSTISPYFTRFFYEPSFTGRASFGSFTSLKGRSPFLLVFIFGFCCLSRRFSTCKWKQKHEKQVTDTM